MKKIKSKLSNHKIKMLSTLLGGIMISMNIFAGGGMHGGGGIGIRCNGRLEVLDLFEARKKGMTLIDEVPTDEKALDVLSNRFTEHFWNPESIAVDEFKAMTRSRYFVPLYYGVGPLLGIDEKGNDISFPIVSVESLPLSGDLGEIDIPSTCQLEQIYYFDDQKKIIQVVSTKLKELSRLDRMSIALHEIMYWAYRTVPMNVDHPYWGNERIVTSQETRKFVSLLLSTIAMPTRTGLLFNPQEVPDKCADYDDHDRDFLENAFYSTVVDGHYYWSFKVLYNYFVPYLTYVEFPISFSNELFDKENGVIEATQGTVMVDEAFYPKSMGLILEVQKRRGENPTMRILNDQNQYIDKGPRLISCEKSDRK